MGLLFTYPCRLTSTKIIRLSPLSPITWDCRSDAVRSSSHHLVFWSPSQQLTSPELSLGSVFTSSPPVRNLLHTEESVILKSVMSLVFPKAVTSLCLHLVIWAAVHSPLKQHKTKSHFFLGFHYTTFSWFPLPSPAIYSLLPLCSSIPVSILIPELYPLSHLHSLPKWFPNHMVLNAT